MFLAYSNLYSLFDKVLKFNQDSIMSADHQDIKNITDTVNKLQLEEDNNSGNTVESRNFQINTVNGDTEVLSANSDTDEEESEEDNDNDDSQSKLVEAEAAFKQKEFKRIKETYGMTEIPDSTPQILPSDKELTEDIPLDTDYIDLIHMKIASLESLGLSRFNKVESLALRDNLIVSLHELKHLSCKSTLQELDLYDNRIKHLSHHINSLKNLKTLDLSFNNIKHIKHLDNLSKLENLYFVQNKIHVIENLDGLKNLKNLEFGGNKIQRISESLLDLPTLEQLWLGQNRITKFENLENLKNLRILSIQSNRIDHIGGLDSLESLEELYVSHNRLTKIEGLDNLKKLEILDITGNKITKIENMKHLKNLTDFWASYNLIDSFESISNELSELPKLETVYFEGNPIQLKNPAQYRTKVKLNLGKSLRKIDALYIASNRMVQ